MLTARAVRSVSSCREFSSVPSTSVAISLMSLAPSRHVVLVAVARLRHRCCAACGRRMACAHVMHTAEDGVHALAGGRHLHCDTRRHLDESNP